MIIQHCYESTELKVLKCLNSRMTLSEKEKQQLYSQEKGYGGELKFEKDWLTELPGETYILNDLLLEYGGNVFQIDSLLISQKIIYIFDVKNYDGDFYLENDKWILKNGREIKDPLEQLKRSESLMRRLLQDLRFNFPIEAYLIFINPEFTLYNAPLDLPAIFPTQLNRFMKGLNLNSSKLDGTYSKLANLLLTTQLDDSKYARIPVYEYEQLQKKMNCGKCNSLVKCTSSGNQCVCLKCGCIDDFETAILRAVTEFQLLFPERKITTAGVFEWCGEIASKKRIRRILSNNFMLLGHGKYSYYVKTE